MDRKLFCLSVVWNHRDRLDAALRSFDEQTRRPDGVVLVDAASRDGTASWLAQNFPYVSTLRLFQRHGLVHAWRQGVRFVLQRIPQEERASTWILFVAPEVVLAPDMCEQLLAEIDRLPDAAAVGPVVLQAWKQCRDDDGWEEIEKTQQIAALGMRLLRNFRWRYGHTGQGFTPQALPEAKPVFALPGLAVAYRAEDVSRALEEDGLWTSSFEESEPLFIDLAMRVRTHGRSSYLTPLATCWRVDHRGVLVGREKWALSARMERDAQRLSTLGASGWIWWKTLPRRVARWVVGCFSRIATHRSHASIEVNTGSSRVVAWSDVGDLWQFLSR